MTYGIFICRLPWLLAANRGPTVGAKKTAGDPLGGRASLGGW